MSWPWGVDAWSMVINIPFAAGAVGTAYWAAKLAREASTREQKTADAQEVLNRAQVALTIRPAQHPNSFNPAQPHLLVWFLNYSGQLVVVREATIYSDERAPHGKFRWDILDKAPHISPSLFHLTSAAAVEIDSNGGERQVTVTPIFEQVHTRLVWTDMGNRTWRRVDLEEPEELLNYVS